MFNLSFHHFDNENAIKLLKNTMETSDGIAIIELQDRRLGCLAMMFFNIFFVSTITPFWQDSSPHSWRYSPGSLLRNSVCNSHSTYDAITKLRIFNFEQHVTTGFWISFANLVHYRLCTFVRCSHCGGMASLLVFAPGNTSNSRSLSTRLRVVSARYRP